jgi:hypothetical protein
MIRKEFARSHIPLRPGEDGIIATAWIACGVGLDCGGLFGQAISPRRGADT